MSAKSLYGFYGLLVSTLVFALFVAVYPLPPSYVGLRPELLCLLVIYWVIHAPQHVGLLCAWLAGIAQDLVEGLVWGAHGMALAIVAYICLMAYQRIKNYSVWHQTLWVFVLVGFHQVIVNWVQGLAGYEASVMDLILSTAVSALFWPLIFFCISRIRLVYRIH